MEFASAGVRTLIYVMAGAAAVALGLMVYEKYLAGGLKTSI